MQIELTAILESFRTLQMKEDGGGLKFSADISENQHDQWSQLSKWKGKPVRLTVKLVGET